MQPRGGARGSTQAFLSAWQRLEKYHNSGLKESWLLGFTLKSFSDRARALFPQPQSQEPPPPSRKHTLRLQAELSLAKLIGGAGLAPPHCSTTADQPWETTPPVYQASAKAAKGQPSGGHTQTDTHLLMGAEDEYTTE